MPLAPRLLALGVVALALGACSGAGVGAVAEDDAFASCVEDAGASLDGSDDWGVSEQQAFWTEPGTLDCAIDELDDDARADALEEAFFEDFSSDEGGRVDQWEVIGRWAAATATDTSVDEAVQRAGPLLSSLWVADADDHTGANGLASVVASSAMYATGELPSYDVYLEGAPDDAAGADSRVAYLNQSQGPTDDEILRHDQLVGDLVAEVRD